MSTRLQSKRRGKTCLAFRCAPSVLLRYPVEKTGWGEGKRRKEREDITQEEVRERQQERDSAQEKEKWKKWIGEGRANLGSN